MFEKNMSWSSFNREDVIVNIDRRIEEIERINFFIFLEMMRYKKKELTKEIKWTWRERLFRKNVTPTKITLKNYKDYIWSDKYKNYYGTSELKKIKYMASLSWEETIFLNENSVSLVYEEWDFKMNKEYACDRLKEKSTFWL